MWLLSHFSCVQVHTCITSEKLWHHSALSTWWRSSYSCCTVGNENLQKPLEQEKIRNKLKVCDMRVRGHRGLRWGRFFCVCVEEHRRTRLPRWQQAVLHLLSPTHKQSCGVRRRYSSTDSGASSVLLQDVVLRRIMRWHRVWQNAACNACNFMRTLFVALLLFFFWCFLLYPSCSGSVGSLTLKLDPLKTPCI